MKSSKHGAMARSVDAIMVAAAVVIVAIVAGVLVVSWWVVTKGIIH